MFMRRKIEDYGMLGWADTLCPDILEDAEKGKNPSANFAESANFACKKCRNKSVKEMAPSVHASFERSN